MSHGSGAGRFSAILVLGRIRNWDYARGHGNDDLNVLTPDLAHSGKGARHGPSAPIHLPQMPRGATEAAFLVGVM
jgi:hypothetical protein